MAKESNSRVASADIAGGEHLDHRAARSRRLYRTFHDRVAIVTGGTSGIGHALCETLGALGATVVVAGRNIERAVEIARLIEERGGKARAEQVDVTVEEGVTRLIEHTVALYGRVDYLFNNAGVGVMGETINLESAHWRTVIDVNLWGVIFGSSVAYRAMARHGSGHIVNVASGAGLFPIGFTVPYSAAKHAVVALSVAMRAEAAAYGVKVSVACPGSVRTNVSRTSEVVGASSEIVEQFIEDGMPPSEAARHILFGVARDRTRIVFPASIRLMWWLSRMSPALWNAMCALHIREVRRRVAGTEPKKAAAAA
ncbi:MAG: SDR family oxidoreductase [Spirochaetaceae bacterium]|nr:MAG: SDR family oxidoreductase [Spirochaetaceae bacterium]